MLTTDKILIKATAAALREFIQTDLDGYISLFFYEIPIQLKPEVAKTLLKAGIIRSHQQQYLPNVFVFPFRDRFITTDFLWSKYRQKDGVYLRENNDVWAMYPFETLLYIENLPDIGGGEALDIASGSGAIAIALAERFDHVVSSDINPKAVAYARFNATLNDLEGKITNIESDVFSSLQTRKFDFISWNGPTMALPEVDDYAKAYPIYAYGGSDGTRFTIKFLEQVFNFTQEDYQIKWLDGCMGTPKESLIEQYFCSQLADRPIQVDIEFLNKSWGIPLKTYEEYYDKYCSGIVDFAPEFSDDIWRQWHMDLESRNLSHIYMSLVTITPSDQFKLSYKDSPDDKFAPEHLYGFDWHVTSRQYIRDYLISRNPQLCRRCGDA